MTSEEREGLENPLDRLQEEDERQPAESTETDMETIRERIVDTMKSVYDPEIPVNIYDLGMVYEIDVQPTGRRR